MIQQSIFSERTI